MQRERQRTGNTFKTGAATSRKLHFDSIEGQNLCKKCEFLYKFSAFFVRKRLKCPSK